eukprot:SAG31_NODE_2022_length_6645_cov_15.375191_1_plen_1048_part_10
MSAQPNVVLCLNAEFLSVPWAAGTITANAKDASGAVVATDSRHTLGKASKLDLSIDAPSKATGEAVLLDGHDAALLRAAIVDSEGRVMVLAQNNVSFRVVLGPGFVQGSHNGDVHCHQPNNAPWHTANHGLVRAVIRVNSSVARDPAELALLARIPSIDNSPFESCVDDGQWSPSCSCSMRHHDLSMLMAEYYSSESASCAVQITNQTTCSRVAASMYSKCAGPFESYGNDVEASFTQSYASDTGDTGDPSQLVCDAVTHNGTDHDALNTNDIHKISESNTEDVEDIPAGASLSADHEQYNPVFDFMFATSCVGLMLAFVYGLIQWYCCPKKLEERPQCGCPRMLFEREVLETKPQVYLVSKRLRRCVALATIRKRFRAWRIDTKKEKYGRIGHVVGVACLFIVMFQPVAQGAAVVSVTSSRTNMTQHHKETALVNASNVHSDMNQLATINDADLKEFIGSLAMELREMKSRLDVVESTNLDLQKENAEMKDTIMELRNENTDLKGRAAGLESANVEIREENANMKDEMVEIRNANVKITNDIVEMRNKNSQIKYENAEIKREAMRLKQTIRKASNITRTETKMLKDAVLNHTQELGQCKAQTSSFIEETVRRRIQGEEPFGDAGVAHIFKRTVITTSHLSGRVDESNGGHRMMSETTARTDCSSDAISRQIDAINTECCDERDESCSNGRVQTCNEGCGALIMPLWTNCGSQLGPAAEILRDAVALCHEDDQISYNEMSAHMFMATCPPGFPASDCIPLCEEPTNGYLLLLNIEGEDSKLTCELHHDIYSWVGGAADGGYIGSDPRAFLSAVVSGAAGTYSLKSSDADLGMDTDISIRPGQVVRVVSTQDSSWGNGAIALQNQASLALINLTLFVNITIEQGHSSLTLNGCEVILPTPLVVPTGSNVTMQVDRTRIGVVRTVDTFSSFQLGIAVDGELTMHALDLFWGSNVYVGIWVAEAGRLNCAQCSMHMTPLGMYSLYQEGAPRFSLPDSSQWQDLTTVLQTLEGHSDGVLSVAFDASGGTLASGSWDQTVKLWDVASGECLRT